MRCQLRQFSIFRDQKMDSYLLSPMKKKALGVVDAMLDTAAEAVNVILKNGPASAMNKFNRKEPE